jgi:uncharacterized protein YhfF
MLPKSNATEALWNAYRAAAGIGPEVDYVVVAFCRAMDPQRATHLAALTLSGAKTATASLARDYGEGTEPLPAIGDHVVLTDGNLVPVCIWRTIEVQVKPMNEADAAFARAEGEDDLSLAAWHKRQQAYFGFQAQQESFELRDDMPTVFERLEVVWPR